MTFARPFSFPCERGARVIREILGPQPSPQPTLRYQISYDLGCIVLINRAASLHVIQNCVFELCVNLWVTKSITTRRFPYSNLSYNIISNTMTHTSITGIVVEVTCELVHAQGILE